MIFVTLFNSLYMSRGLTMYESLKSVLSDFKLYIVAFDNDVCRMLYDLQLENVVVISLNEFEDEELLKAKNNRDEREYCWTCASKSIEYVLECYNEDCCTYLDSDLMFFDSPAALLNELDEKEDVIITEHRYSDYCDQTNSSGKYCVQFVTVKNTENGRKMLRWWVERCIEWCYARQEDGKFGDQKYLERFPELFSGVHELKHLGGGVAPWNVSQYTFYNNNEKIYLKDKESLEEVPLIFYHFHGVSFFDKDVVQLSDGKYIIPDTAISHIYKSYFRAIESTCRKYNLNTNRQIWNCVKEFRDNDMDALMHDKLYFNYSLFI